MKPPFFGILLLVPTLCAAVDVPPRLFFSDAKLSFAIPDPWEVSSSFPYGPLMSRKTPEGSEAFVVCQISEALDRSRLSADISTDSLKELAAHEVGARRTGARVVAETARTLAGRNAYEMTTVIESPEGATQDQSVYFFLDNRFYVLSLRAKRDSFPWLVQDFQNWLGTVHFLFRQDSGKLEAPARGGLWVHQTGGAKITVPTDWLIGVADDRQLGATLARDKMHLAFSAVADVASPATPGMSEKEKEEARKTLLAKDYKIVGQSDEPFHGLPAFQLTYEGAADGRFIRGQDVWVSGPKARWLISIDGDSRLMRQLADNWQGLLSGIHFDE